MAKEIYLYYPILDFVAQSVISDINDNMGKPCTMRVCSPGGSVRAGYGIFAKMKEHGSINVKVDGSADSMASFLPMYAKNSECLNVSRFVFHRADMIVENGEDQKYLDGVNEDLKTQMKARINPERWKAITDITIDDLFDPNTRKDYIITGPQAVEIGLCDSLKMLTPSISDEIQAINKKFYQVAAHAEPSIKSKMTTSEFKEKHPEIFSEIKSELKKEISEKEKDRIGSWMVFYDVDPEAVKKGIESGEKVSQTKLVEFTAKLVSGKHLSKIESENASSTHTKEIPAAEKVEDKEAKEAQAAFDDKLKDLIKSKKIA